MSLTKFNTRLNVATKFIFGSEILPSACETKSNFIQGQTALYSVWRYRIIKHNQYIDTNRFTNYYIDELLRQNFQKSIPSLSHYLHLQLDIIISFYLLLDKTSLSNMDTDQSPIIYISTFYAVHNPYLYPITSNNIFSLAKQNFRDRTCLKTW